MPLNRFVVTALKEPQNKVIIPTLLTAQNQTYSPPKIGVKRATK